MISIIIPTYNEEKIIAATLRTLTAGLASCRDMQSEIIVSDGGSSDRTVELAHDQLKHGLQASRRERSVAPRRRHISGAQTELGVVDQAGEKRPAQIHRLQPLEPAMCSHLKGERAAQPEPPRQIDPRLRP